MDSTAITAAAAIGGSLVGGFASFATAYFSQRHQVHTARLFKELDRREELYSHFNQLAAELLFDALDHQLEQPARLVGLIAATGRVRLIGSDAVLHAAERVVATILTSYDAPPIDPHEVVKRPGDFAAPLVAFTEACRAERLGMLERI